MRYDKINNQLFKENRQRFAQKMDNKSIAVFNSNDIMPTNEDSTMPFRQNNDIFYLSGIDQEESILLLCPDAINPAHREILFIRETNEHIATWEGDKLNKEQGTDISGVQTVMWANDFESTFRILANASENIYLNTNEHGRAAIEVKSRDRKFIDWCKENFPLHNYKRSAPITYHLRAIKSEIEKDIIQKACKITEKGFRRVLKFVKPGVNEYEIEAEYAHEFLRNKAQGFAYTPIVASGFNSCVLHYVDNEKVCKDGDLLLMDVAAEYANYASDMTRTIPVNGKYTPRQKEVYNAVLRVMKKAMPMLRPGVIIKDYHQEVGKMIESELIGLNLLDKEAVKKQDPKNPLYKKYFMHGTSHHMGLNVHDVADVNRPIEVGMVFTCEPGIYIRDENIGIRIENDIYITEDGYIDLMKDIPLEVEEIEELMNE